jgi:hypothetical protein
MMEATMNDVKEVPKTTPKPVFTPLPLSDPWEACDHCPDVRALVSVLLPTGGILVMCGNCARKNFGYEHTAYAKPENRQQGSAS